MDTKDVDPKNWLRCNLCFCLMCKSKDPFSLTFCGHIFCNKCIRKASHQCPQCKAKDVPSMTLEEPLRPEIKHCFESTVDLSEKLRQANLFHEVQRSLNIIRLSEVEKKYAFVKNEFHRKSKEVQILKEKYQKLLVFDENLHKQLRELESKQSKLSHHTISFMNTPMSAVSSVRSDDQQSIGYSDSVKHIGPPFMIPEHLQRSVLRPTHSQSIDRNGVFRVPNITKVPRSVGSSVKSARSSRDVNSSRGTPFSNYTPGSNRS